MKINFNFIPYRLPNTVFWVWAIIIVLHGQSFAGQYDRYVVGTVINVRDGDTVSVRVANTDEILEIRLYGINAPEKNKSYYAEATQFLKNHTLGKLVELYITGKGKYSRYIAKIYCNSKYINLMLVSSGLATHYKQFSKDKDLALAEAEARRCRIGIWDKNSK